MVKICQTSFTMGSKGLRSNISRGIKIRPYFDIHLNWHCHQSPRVLHPGFIHLQTLFSDAFCTLQAQMSTYPWKESQGGLPKQRFPANRSSWLFTFPYAGLPAPIHRCRAEGVAEWLQLQGGSGSWHSPNTTKPT